MAFTVNIQNIKQAIGIQVTFILKDDLHLSGKKVQKEHFLAKKHCLSGNLCVHFEPLLRCECAYVCPNIRTEKEGIYCKQSPCKTSNWHTSDFHHRKKAFKINNQNIKQIFGIQVTFILKVKPQKERFLGKYDCFFGDLYAHFQPLLGWKCACVCHDLITEKKSI